MQIGWPSLPLGTSSWQGPSIWALGHTAKTLAETLASPLVAVVGQFRNFSVPSIPHHVTQQQKGLMGLLQGVNELIHVEHLEWCLAGHEHLLRKC